MLGEAAHHPKQRRIGLQRQTQFLLQCRFTARLASRFFGIKAMGNSCISGRIPYRFIHRIEDAAQVISTGAQQAVKPAALLRRLDFLRIGRAHRGDVVGVIQARFHERQLAMKLQTVH